MTRDRTVGRLDASLDEPNTSAPTRWDCRVASENDARSRSARARRPDLNGRGGADSLHLHIRPLALGDIMCDLKLLVGASSVFGTAAGLHPEATTAARAHRLRPAALLIPSPKRRVLAPKEERMRVSHDIDRSLAGRICRGRIKPTLDELGGELEAAAAHGVMKERVSLRVG
eukprot:scaffold97378_cov29-Tisochrysis_lutea.AAC.1